MSGSSCMRRVPTSWSRPTTSTRPRLRALAPDLDLGTVEDLLCTVQAVCRGDSGRGLPHLEGLGRRFGWLTAPRSTIVQPSPRHGGLCEDPAVELQRLMALLVGP